MRGSPGSSGRSGSQGPPVSSFGCFFLRDIQKYLNGEWYPLSTEVWWSPNWPTLRWSYSLTDSSRLRVSSVRQPAQELGLIPRNNGWWSSQPIANQTFLFFEINFRMNCFLGPVLYKIIYTRKIRAGRQGFIVEYQSLALLSSPCLNTQLRVFVPKEYLSSWGWLLIFFV